ncbi:MAG: hypothetical protein K2Y23_08945 [Cyanobacteria bacterium]|nr:hypothetical protein [Cyanobacteriota bacterium]
MSQRVTWPDVLNMARDLSFDVLPAGAPRHLLLVIASFANRTGMTFVGVADLAHGMGYCWSMNESGELIGNGRRSFERTFRKLRQKGLAARTPCDCIPRRHACHFQLDLALLGKGQTATPRTAKRLHREAVWSNSSAAPGWGHSAPHNSITEHQVRTNATENANKSQPRKASVTHASARAGMSLRQYRRMLDEQHAARIKAAKAALAQEAGDRGEIDE